MQPWDVICIGSGITALAFGAQLVAHQPGKRVLVLEKHYVPGGYATTFRRKRWRFDCSLHKLSGVCGGGNLRRIFGDMGLLDDLSLVYPPSYFAVVSGDYRFELSSNYLTFKEQLWDRFPAERAGLTQLFSEVELHGRNGYYQMQTLAGQFIPDIKSLRYAHQHLRRATVAEAFGERFRDPLLKEILAAPAIYVGGFAEDFSYLYYLHVIYATLCCGSAYLLGGSQQLSNTLVNRLTTAGGELKLRTEVSRILVGNNRAFGVETNRGTFLGKQIYINASPQYALEHLLPADDCLSSVRRKLVGLKPSWSTTTLYLTTDVTPESLGLISCEAMIFASLLDRAGPLRVAAVANTGVASGLCEEAFWQSSTMEVTNYHALDPQGGNVLCVNVLDTMRHWPARGTPEYKAKKQRASAVLLARLLDHYPALRGHVVYQELSSPHTYFRYTNNYNGAGYGALVGTDASSHLFHYQFPISGIHFLSAWVAGPSYEAAFGYAEHRARNFASS